MNRLHGEFVRCSVASARLSAALLFNAASFLVIAVVLYRWHRPMQESVLPSERTMEAIRAGMRYVRHSPAFRNMSA